MGWHWNEVGSYFTLCAFIIVLALVIILFHHIRFLREWIPESCVLIGFGIVIGALVQLSLPPTPNDRDLLLKCNTSSEDGYENATASSTGPAFPTFTPDLFFFVLLPPVILESAYSLYDVDFATNIGTILLYAVVGTLLNTFLIGPILFGLFCAGLMGTSPLVAVQEYDTLHMTDALVFSSLISAVDPVAVLAIFQETHIDRILYFLVFGESLLNDAVTVGLYHTMLEFAEEQEMLSAVKLLLACIRLLAVGVVGLIFGVMYGLLTALLTRITFQVRVLEPLLLLGLAYMAYLTAELFQFSGIIGIIGCGLVQARYAMKNISTKSYTTVKYFTKMASAISEAVIFLFLGMALRAADLTLHWPFIAWTLVLCLVCRFFAVFLLTWIANRYRLRTICRSEQFIMAYGGLRGAICFSLVHMLDPCVIHPRSLFLTATLVVIFFTVFVQGTTIKPLMNAFHIKRDEDDGDLLLLDIHQNVVDVTLAGVEQITGITGQFSLVNKMRKWDERYLQKWFLCPGTEPGVLRAYRKHAIHELQCGKPIPVGMHQPLNEEDDNENTGRKISKMQDKKDLRKVLAVSRPVSRYVIDDDDDCNLQVEDSAIRFRKRSSQMLHAIRLQQALSRQTRPQTNILDNSTFYTSSDCQNETPV